MQTVAAQWTYHDLETLLSEEEWQAADLVTFKLMLAAADRGRAGWLDADAIAQFPCAVLHEIDQRWTRYSSGHFGFSVQHDLYVHEAQRNAFALSRTVEWTAVKARPFGFFKFYDFLEFSLDAPRGQFPALWFWRLPWHRSLLMGGFGTGRGGGFGDAALLDAMMLRLERCQFL